jgi:hypothetical protein
MAMSKSPFKFDKTLFSFVTHAELKAAEKAFWLSKTPLERLAATELMRQIAYGYDPLTARVQRTLTVISLKDLKRPKRWSRRKKNPED